MTSLLVQMNGAEAFAADKQALSWRQRAAVFAVLTGMALVVLDAAIANVALPTIGRSLSVAPASTMLVVTAYQLALVMALLPSAALGESIGHHRVFGRGIALFVLTSVLCALAPSLPWLVVARFIQGLGGAAVMSLGMALLRQIVSRSQLAAAIGWYALTIALSAAAGPALGAMILSGGSWRWLFAVNLPVGLLAFMSTSFLPQSPGTSRRLDLISAVTNAGAFGSLVVGAELLPKQPLLALALLSGAVAGFAVLAKRELPRSTPLIPFDLLRQRSFRLSVLASVLCFSGQTSGLVALPFLLQHSLHQSALMTGLFVTPWPLAIALVSPVASRLADRVKAGWLCFAGGSLLALGLGAIVMLAHRDDPLSLVPFVILSGTGFGLFQVSNNREMFLAAPLERSGAAGGMQGTARLTGQTIGAVMMSLLFELTSAEETPLIGMSVAAALAFSAGAISTLRLVRGDERREP